MIPRSFRRCSSTHASRRVGRKGLLYGRDQTIDSPTPTLEELVRQTKRRVEKAERDERKDITAALTPVKTYMGGFTRPKDLRATNWFHGGPYETSGKIYESPTESAYQPHTVFMLESRHPIRHKVGRVDSHEYFVGVCAEKDLYSVVRLYNSKKCPIVQREEMDNARWPWLPQYKYKRTVWWEKGEDPNDIIRRVYEDELSTDTSYDFSPKESTAVKKCVEEEFLLKNVTKKPILTRRPEGKMPYEEVAADGSIFHPSGFVVPEPGEAPESFADHRVRHQELNRGIPNGVREFSELSEMSSVKLTPGGGSRTYATAVVAPPFPFISDATSDLSESPVADEVDSKALERKYPTDPEEIRAQYLPTLEENPFWRPLLTLTFATRPLALSVARLAKALPRGLAYYAAITSDDRKSFLSFNARMRSMRIARMQALAQATAERLEGRYGGFVGIRFDTAARGRGISGEGLADPLPREKRLVKVGVGRYYRFADEIREWFESQAEAYDVCMLDDKGRRLGVDGEVDRTEEYDDAKVVELLPDEDADSESGEHTEVYQTPVRSFKDVEVELESLRKEADNLTVPECLARQRELISRLGRDVADISGYSKVVRAKH